MAFAQRLGKPVTFPRNEHVDIHVQRVRLNADDITDHQTEVIEIREFLKEPGLYGHGLVINTLNIADLRTALDRVAPVST